MAALAWQTGNLAGTNESKGAVSFQMRSRTPEMTLPHISPILGIWHKETEALSARSFLGLRVQEIFLHPV